MPAAQTFTLRTDLAELARVQTAVATLLEEEGVPPKAAYVVDLAIEELITNVIKYAYADAAAAADALAIERRGEHAIRMSLSFTPDDVVLRVEDDGRPFDPLAAPPPNLDAPIEDRPVGGLGVHLVRQMAREVSYRRVDGKNIVEVHVSRADV